MRAAPSSVWTPGRSSPSALAQLAPGARVRGLRDVAPRLSQPDGGLLAHAAALLHWHRSHPHCSRCGARDRPDRGRLLAPLPACGAVHHPRTDPVVIMLVVDGDRALLGRQARWPPGRWSAFAGFVEPGESLEEAVAREVLEEADVRVDAIAYRSSQPWPFPASLMLGFVARYAGGEARARDGELEGVRWFSRPSWRPRGATGPVPAAARRDRPPAGGRLARRAAAWA